MGLYFGNNRPSKIFAGINNVTKVFWGNVQVWASGLYRWLKYGCTFVWNKYDAVLTSLYNYDVYEGHYNASTSSGYASISAGMFGSGVYYASSITWNEDGTPYTGNMTYDSDIPATGQSKSYTGLYVYYPPSTIFSTDLSGTIWYSPTYSHQSAAYVGSKYIMSGTKITVNSVNLSVGAFKRAVSNYSYDRGDTYVDVMYSEYWVKTATSQGYKRGTTQYEDASSTQRNAYPDNGTPDNTYWYVYSNYTRDASPVGSVYSDDPSAYPDDGLQGDFYYIKQV